MCCRAAVERAFRELTLKGEPAVHAREAALVLFRWHHPEVPAEAAAETVAAWTSQVTLH